ncbi:non-ribosomal peptide synthetase [Ralstonia solanacearum]|nr:non-ribosomal peptide synthetase [Ralstonia solanacearum]
MVRPARPRASRAGRSGPLWRPVQRGFRPIAMESLGGSMTTHALTERATLVDWIEHHARARPLAEALFFCGHGADDLRLGYGALSERVRRCAAALQQRGAAGSTALILFPSGIDYVVALLACFYAGVTGVPVNLPGVSRVRRVLPKLGDITRDCRPAVVLTHTAIEHASGNDLRDFAAGHGLDILHLDTLGGEAAAWVRPALTPESIAFLQYTSGSTGSPKGVVNRHGALLRNLQFLGRLTRPQDRAPEDTAVASWLPLFHDLGLIMGILLPLAYGNRAVYMAPMAFVADPLRWLEIATAERATALPCPSFALRLCADEARSAAPARLAGIDLSSVQCLMPAAEPVLPSQIEAFQAAFAAHGMRREAIRPAYGLAEATLLVSANVDDAPPHRIDVETAPLEQGRAVVHPAAAPMPAAGRRRYVSNGREFDGQDVRIVDPRTCATLPEGAVGEIWISGPCIAGGYWNKAELNREIFMAETPGAEDRRYLRTGDMGFLHGGHLFVTGRLKDMMLFRGQCHYPNDIEATSGRAHAAAIPESGAAFSIQAEDEAGERLVIVQEVRKQAGIDPRDIATAVRAAVAEGHALGVHAVVLIRKGTLPRTTSGKVRRAAVREAWLAGTLQTLWQDNIDNLAVPPTPAQETAAAPADAALLAALAPLDAARRQQHLVQWLAARAAAALGTVAARAIRPEASLFGYGLDSMSATRLAAVAAAACGLALPDSLLFDHPSLAGLAGWLLQAMEQARHLPPAPGGRDRAMPAPRPAAHRHGDGQDPIAIIGMAFRLPGESGRDADTDAAFWRLLDGAGCAIRPMPAERFRAPAGMPGFGAYLNQVDRFDAAFFGMSPREAMNTDPQQRLLLEVAWHALEDAGLPPGDLRGSDSGVFVGIGTADYGHLPFISGDDAHFDAYWGTGTSFAAACGRLSFTFGWEGPSMAVDTACSASHSALHLAVQALRARECGMALSAGVKLQLLPEIDRVLHKAGMLAADGRCKTLDASANGYVRGEGCVVLVLKRLSDALADGDAIRAVIRDTLVRQDGAGSSLSAPNGEAQQRLLSLALARAGLAPSEIDYIELHGTGTRLGDPIEYQSVADVFGGRAPDDPLWIGSVKTNIGHLESAAGAAGLVKTVLALEQARIPPLVGLKGINPLIDLDAIPARAPAHTVDWPARQAVRRAGVTSYGFAGTIAHVILEQAPVAQAAGTEPARGPHLFLLSARSPDALRRLAAAYRDTLAGTADLAVLANGMARQREHHALRAAVVASDHDECARALDRLAAPDAAAPEAVTRAPRVGFLFTGQGSQYAGMTRALYAAQPDFRAALDAADAALAPHLGRSILALMHDDAQRDALQQTAHAQPALFACGYALAAMWQAWGVVPAVLVGHSIGEFAAMVVAGAMTLEDAARLIVRRGALMQALPAGGAMLAARATPRHAHDLLAALAPAVAAEVSLAAINGPQDVVFSGSAAGIDAVRARLDAQQLDARPLAVSHAFHSPLLDPMLGDWAEACADAQSAPPRIPLISTLTGAPMATAPDAAYWSAHARQPVRFAEARARARADCDVLLEIGAHAVLSALAQRNQLAQPWPHPVACVASLRRGTDDSSAVAQACADLYLRGQPFDWDRLFAGPLPSPRALPRYPFDRQSHWLEYDEDAPRTPLPMQPQPERAAPRPVERYAVQWEPFAPSAGDGHASTYWIVAADAADAGTADAGRLAARLSGPARDVHVLSPAQWADAADRIADDDVVIYLAGWPARAPDAAAVAGSRHVWQLTECVRTLQRLRKTPRILLPTLHGQSPDGAPCDPLQAALWGAARPLSLEYPGPAWLLADCAGESPLETLADALPALLPLFGKEEAVALRAGGWLRPRLTPQAAHGATHLVLAGRRAPPAGWQARLALLRAQGVRIDPVDADLAEAADVERLFDAVAALEATTGRTLAGVFHCAGTSRFNDLAGLTPDDCAAVTGAKMTGAWLLHEQTRARRLDWFVCFTSISGVWGSRLQIPYGAANAFQDALVRLRRAQGLPALAVAWGPWGGGAGMSEVDDALLQLLRAAGIRRLAPSRYLATLDHLLGHAEHADGLPADGTCVVAEVDWQQFIPLFALYNPIGTFERCRTDTATHAAAAPSALIALDSGARADAVRAFVIAELARTLRVAPSQLTPDIELLKLGMDSILVMDFSRRCESGLGVKCELKAIFERNTPGGLASYLLERLEHAPQGAVPAPAAAEPIVHAPDHAHLPFPLTELQHAYWIGRQGHYALGGVACHAYLEADAADGLDLGLLERCWNALVARHGALRLVIDESGQQRILPRVPAYRIRVADLGAATPQALAAHCDDWRQAMSHQVLDAAQWPLFDVRATHLPGGATRLHIGIDMLINDATSGQIIWDELAALYHAGGDLERAGLAPFEISFRDYVLAKYVHSEARRAARESAKAYWLGQLETLPPAPQLPLRAEALHRAAPRFSRRQHRLSPPQWQSLRDRAAASGCTPASLLIAVFAEVLSAWSTEPRFTLNLTTFDRLPWHADVPRLLGDFTAVTLLPLDCAAPLPFGQRAAAVNGAVLEHLQHRAFSAVDVLREWNRGRERQDAVSMPVVFTSQLGMSDPTKGAARASVLGTVGYGISQTPQVWLDHQACELDGALIYNWDAVDALFQPGVLDAMFDAYNRMLERLATDADAWLEPLPALLPQAQREVRARVNASTVPLPERCLDQLFFDQAARQPQAPALIANDLTWTYAQLAGWSRRLANGLAQAGVQRGDRVAVVMRKGAEQVAACLGIQAAGGAYVPVDAQTPAARLHAILQGSRIRVALTQADCLPIVRELTQALDVRVIDASHDAVAGWPDAPPTVARDPLDPAYVIYTSGSTGTPKGVLIDHRGAVNTVLDINRRFGITAGDRVLGLSALYFDLSVYDLFGSFAAGGTLVLPQPGGVRDPAHWLALATRHGVTVWNSVPALLELLLDEAEAAGQTLPGIGHVFLSGDWIPLHLPARLRALAPAARLIAMGGATEASIWSNWFRVDEVPAHWHSIPYGYPLGNQRYRVLDTHLRDCPDHVTGDLCIGGIGLALGYENDPERTAASFFHHPLDGERLYRTGDLARYWPDGTLEFLGRRDFQVKIAGNRIELGEIESALLRHAGLRDAVVDAIGPARGNKRLAAWVVPKPGDASLFETLEGDAGEHRAHWSAITTAAQAVFDRARSGALPGAPCDAASLARFWSLMDRAGRRMMLDTLHAAGLAAAQALPDAEAVLRAVRPAPAFAPLVRRWLDTLDAAGADDAPDTASDWPQLLPAAERFGLPRGALLRLRAGATQRLAVLRGEASALELFYGADSTLAPEHMTRMNPLSGVALGALAEAIRCAAQRLGRPPRILEVGARSGAAARELLALLDDCALDYTLSDPARALIEQAEREHAAPDPEPPHTVAFRVFDPEQPATAQGLPEYAFDVVVAFNALHRSRNIPALLDRVRALLGPGGMLLAPEITRNSTFQLATVALLESGYTQFNDSRHASGDALLGAPAWCGAFSAARFAAAAALGIDPAEAAHTSGMHLLAARQADRVARFSPRRLIEHLASLLPAYMVPQTILRLDALPLSVTGKVVRAQLPRPEAGAAPRRGRPRGAGAPPVSDDLAGIWRELLGVTDLVADDDFFDLGGDSLIAVRLIERVRHGLHAHVALPDLFEAPTLGAFAGRVAQAAPYDDPLPALEADPANRHAPFPLTDVQQAYWIGRDASFELGGVSTHLYAEIEVDDVPMARLERAWQQVVDRHDMLRAVIDPNGMQRVLPEVPDYRIACQDLRGCGAAEVSEWLEIVRLELSHEAPDTTGWPLFTVRAARMSDTRVRLFISLDNLVCDGRSMRTLLAEWSRLAREPGTVLPPLSATFRDYVLLTEQLALRPSYQRSLRYWHDKLGTLPPAPALPRGRHAADAVSPPHFTRREASLPPAQWQALQRHAAQAGVTVNALLLAAYGEVLANWCATPRFTLNLTLFNRPAVHPQIDALVGDFTSLVLLAFDGTAALGFAQRALAMQRQIWADLEHMQVSAVRVLREAARRNRRLDPVAMPVVFTSGLGVAGDGDSEMDWLGHFVYGVSQTPQVWIDQQVVERNGALVYNWDAVDALFPDGLLDDMFRAYRDLLLRLAEQPEAWQRPVRGDLPASRWPVAAPAASAAQAAPQADAGPALAVDDAILATVRGMLGALTGRGELPVQVNFFELGATSLDLIRLRQQLMAALKLPIPVTDVFTHTSIAALAAHLRGLGAVAAHAQDGARGMETGRAPHRRHRLGNDRRRKRSQQSQV